MPATDLGLHLLTCTVQLSTVISLVAKNIHGSFPFSFPGYWIIKLILIVSKIIINGEQELEDIVNKFAVSVFKHRRF